jgi:hypothetical protein
VLAAGFLLLVLAAAAAEAEPDAGPKPVEVQFEGPAGCSGADAFFASLRSRTTHVRAADGDEPRTIVQVRLSRERGRVVGQIRTIENNGATDTRKVQGASCDDVVQALSLTAALALDPTAVLSVSPEDSATEAATPSPPAGPVNAPTPAPAVNDAAAPSVEKPAPAVKEQPKDENTADGLAAPSAPGTDPSWELGAGLVGLALLSGDFSPGAELDVHKYLGGGGVFRPALGLTLLYARNDVLQTPADAAAALVAAGIALCPARVRTGALTLQPCVSVLGGMLAAAGRQLTHEQRVDRFWLSTGLALRVSISLGHGLSLRLEGGFQVPLYRRRYFATLPSNVIAETPRISPLVGLGLTYGW